jgi:hypothetical protein
MNSEKLPWAHLKFHLNQVINVRSKCHCGKVHVEKMEQWQLKDICSFMKNIYDADGYFICECDECHAKGKTT